MKVAVTGASGHIGNCLVRELNKKGIRVKVLVHKFKNDLDKLDVELIQGNLLELESLVALCEGADIVFHLAAQIVIENRSSPWVFETNITGTRNILDAAKHAGVKKFIHFSSIHAFQTGPQHQILDETRPLIETNNTIYEFTKAEGEREVLKAVKEGLDAVILNPTAVIGPFDYRDSLLGQAIRKIFQSKLPFLVSGGYNWVDVRDVVSAAIQAIDLGRKGEKYILSGEYCSLLLFLFPLHVWHVRFFRFTHQFQKRNLYIHISHLIFLSIPRRIFQMLKPEGSYCMNPDPWNKH
jgi:dihydroflavonol-4-reductase